MQILVVGAGTMGAGIAELAARQGLEVGLFDVQGTERAQEKIRASLQRSVERGKLAAEAPVLARLTCYNDLGQAPPPEWVIEAVPEDLALKKELFARLSTLFPEALLASNTSALSLTEIAASSARPGGVVGLHFFNPPVVMPLLEIVEAEQTSPETLRQARDLGLRLGKESIVVKDTAGFATSRLGIVLGMEAIRMVESGVASVADIDKAMELGYRHPMGPLKLTDLVGLDVRLAIAEHLTRELGPQFQPPPLLRRLVRAGKLGKKTGQGFYSWDL